MACKDKNNLPLGEKMRRVYDQANCTWEVDELGAYTPKDAFAYSVSIACNHCDRPLCLESCPVGEMCIRDRVECEEGGLAGDRRKRRPKAQNARHHKAHHQRRQQAPVGYAAARISPLQQQKREPHGPQG